MEAYVSVGRLTDFLVSKELQADAVNIVTPSRDTKLGDELISVQQGDFTWNSVPAAPTATGPDKTLEDISLSVKKGELIAVVGRVGAGKSSLLSAVLGEMNKLDGQVTVRGSVAYTAQQPWIMGKTEIRPPTEIMTDPTRAIGTGGTVKSNITFGYRYEHDFYQLVLEACALKEDLKILPNGDEVSSTR